MSSFVCEWRINSGKDNRQAKYAVVGNQIGIWTHKKMGAGPSARNLFLTSIHRYARYDTLYAHSENREDDVMNHEQNR